MLHHHLRRCLNIYPALNQSMSHRIRLREKYVYFTKLHGWETLAKIKITAVARGTCADVDVMLGWQCRQVNSESTLCCVCWVVLPGFETHWDSIGPTYYAGQARLSWCMYLLSQSQYTVSCTGYVYTLNRWVLKRQRSLAFTHLRCWANLHLALVEHCCCRPTHLHTHP